MDRALITDTGAGRRGKMGTRMLAMRWCRFGRIRVVAVVVDVAIVIVAML